MIEAALWLLVSIVRSQSPARTQIVESRSVGSRDNPSTATTELSGAAYTESWLFETGTARAPCLASQRAASYPGADKAHRQ